MTKKRLIFDAGPIISLTLNNLLWLLEPLHREFRGTFYIPVAVKKELVERPLSTKKFKFEALQVMPYISNGTLEVIENDYITNKSRELIDLANRCFKGKGNWIKIIQEGEMEAVATAMYFKSETIVVDERVTRMLIESPSGVRSLLEHRLHTRISVNQDNLNKFHNMVKHIRVIRSVELVTIAFERGLLVRYLDNEYVHHVKNAKGELLDAILWGVKLNGCAVSKEEINDIVRIEKKEGKI